MTVAAANALATAHLSLVHVLAARTCRRVYPRVELDELKCAGAVGLVEAAQRFNPTLGIPFGAFARRRITGAMIDYLRLLDPATRQQRAAIEAGAPNIIAVDLDEALDQPETSSENPHVDALRRELAAHVREAILTLDPQYQRVIVEHYFDGKTYRAIAKGLWTNQPAKGHKQRRWRKFRTSGVAQLHAKALRQLRTALLAKGLTAECLNN